MINDAADARACVFDRRRLPRESSRGVGERGRARDARQRRRSSLMCACARRRGGICDARAFWRQRWRPGRALFLRRSHKGSRSASADKTLPLNWCCRGRSRAHVARRVASRRALHELNAAATAAATAAAAAAIAAAATSKTTILSGARSRMLTSAAVDWRARARKS